MHGGAIKNNSSTSAAGVYVLNSLASFTMTGGIISDNNAIGGVGGGGVYVISGARFTMSGGIISGNTAPRGGGVYVETLGSVFEKTGGIIYGNEATVDPVSLKNTATMSGNPGHAVFWTISSKYRNITLPDSAAGNLSTVDATANWNQ